MYFCMLMYFPNNFALYQQRLCVIHYLWTTLPNIFHTARHPIGMNYLKYFNDIKPWTLFPKASTLEKAVEIQIFSSYNLISNFYIVFFFSPQGRSQQNLVFLPSWKLQEDMMMSIFSRRTFILEGYISKKILGKMIGFL